MGQVPDLTEAAVRRVARTKSFKRGENYYDQDAVLDLVQRGKTLRAEVEGSQYEPYEVRIDLDDTGIVETECSCPYDHGGICKHRVAVLLTYIRDPDAVAERPPVPDLLADFDRDTLADLFADLLKANPELTEWVEREIKARSSQAGDVDGTDGSSFARQSAPDPETVRRHVDSILHPSSPPTRGGQDPYAAVESQVDDLRDLLAQAHTAIEAGDGTWALDHLDAMATELMGEEWLALSYDDSQAIFEFLDELSQAFTEALLVADLSDNDREALAESLSEWADELSSYTPRPPFQTAVAAANRGWDDETLQQAMAGSVEEGGLWDDNSPWYADELVDAWLTVLDRQGRTEEYLNLARAAGYSVKYATKLIDLDRQDEAVDYVLDHLSAPDEALTVARAFRNAGYPSAAIDVAHHGLSLDGRETTQLAEWLRDVATASGDGDIAKEAAVTAFKSDPTMATYRAVEEVVGDDWSTVRQELLDHLQQRSPGRDTAREYAEIFLSEGRIENAISIAENSGHRTVVEPVVEAVWSDRPDWTIEMCKQHAEPIIEQGESDRYEQAVVWLRYAGQAARESGTFDAWQEYVETIRDDHYRKYKLRPMLEDLLAEFSAD